MKYWLKENTKTKQKNIIRGQTCGTSLLTFSFMGFRAYTNKKRRKKNYMIKERTASQRFLVLFLVQLTWERIYNIYYIYIERERERLVK